MNEFHDVLRRRRDFARAVEKSKKSQPTERQPSEYLFPINRLPQDILAEVFVQCLPTFDQWSLSTKGVAPLLLCSVCSSWRKLALSVPRLWQRLSIRFADKMLFLRFASDMFNSTNSTAEEPVALIHGWIKRSGVLPLALSLRVTSSYRSQVPMVEAMLGAFIQYASRWEHFHFHCMDFIPITFPEFGDMPHVRSFTLSCPGLEDPKLQISSWPMLTVLRWPLHPTASSSHSPPWHQLTRLALGCSMKARETLFVIQSCPRLTELEIKYYDDDDDIPDQSPRGIAVVNDCLRKLNLNVGESCAQLLKRLTLPALTEMTLYFDSCVPRIHKALLRFFTRSKCKLDRLDLADPNFDGDMLLKCLKHDSCASITNLSIANIYIKPMVTDSVLVALADVSDVLLPNLAHLELHMCLSGSPGWLGAMLLSRCIKKDHELKTVRILCRSLSRSDAILVAFVKTRLKVTLDIDDS